MSAVEQAREAVLDTMRIGNDGWCDNASDEHNAINRSRAKAENIAEVSALIAAVRAEQDAKWREGVEAETRKVRPVTCRECKPGEACADALREAEESAANRALATLVARMEAP